MSFVFSSRRWEIGYEYQSIIDEKWFQFKDSAILFLISTEKNCLMVIFAKNQLISGDEKVCLDKVILKPTISKIHATLKGREVLMEVPTVPQKRINITFKSKSLCKEFYKEVNMVMSMAHVKADENSGILSNFSDLEERDQRKLLVDLIPSVIQDNTFRALVRSMKSVWNASIDREIQSITDC